VLCSHHKLILNIWVQFHLSIMDQRYEDAILLLEECVETILMQELHSD
jgi:hypothetical protein